VNSPCLSLVSVLDRAPSDAALVQLLEIATCFPRSHQQQVLRLGHLGCDRHQRRHHGHGVSLDARGIRDNN